MVVTGSGDNTIQLWGAWTCGQLGNAHKENITNSLSPIHFSSSAAHALHDSQSLFIDFMSNANHSLDYQGLIQFQNDGWIVGPNG